MFFPITFSLPFTGEEWSIYQQTIGPRGGKHWNKIRTETATGATYTTKLEPGVYKIVYYDHRIARSEHFNVTDTGETCYEDDLSNGPIV